MKKRIAMAIRGAALAALLVCAFPAMADHHVTLGDWSMVMDFEGQEVPGTLTIMEADGGGLAGKWTANGESKDLSDVKFEDGTLSFVRPVEYQGSEFDINFTGTIDGDSITGAFTTPAGDLATTGTRGAGDSSGGDMKKGIAGTWKLMVESQLGDNERTLKINDDMTGTYITDEGESEVQDLKVSGSDVSFSVSLSLQGQDLALEFKGKLDGDSLTGEMFMDGSSVAEVDGERAGGGGSIPAGEYNLTVDSQIGVFQQKLTVKEDGTMVYESDGEETTPENVQVDGINVTFDITVHADGSPYDLQFEGTFEDGKLEGKFLMDGGEVADVYIED